MDRRWKHTRNTKIPKQTHFSLCSARNKCVKFWYSCSHSHLNVGFQRKWKGMDSQCPTCHCMSERREGSWRKPRVVKAIIRITVQALLSWSSALSIKALEVKTRLAYISITPLFDLLLKTDKLWSWNTYQRQDMIRLLPLQSHAK